MKTASSKCCARRTGLYVNKQTDSVWGWGGGERHQGNGCDVGFLVALDALCCAWCLLRNKTRCLAVLSMCCFVLLLFFFSFVLLCGDERERKRKKSSVERRESSLISAQRWVAQRTRAASTGGGRTAGREE